MERIAVDVLGPLPMTDSGNQYILLAQDYFTKWPEAFPVPDQQASTVADVLVNEFFSRFGVPMELHTDQGRNFESELFQEVYLLLGIKKTRIKKTIFVLESKRNPTFPRARTHMYKSWKNR